MSRSYKHFEWPDNYYIWLCDLIDLETHSGNSNLISFLYDTEFTWSVPRDNNRAHDGIDLRQDYISEYQYDDGEWVEDACSWLEMLIALARRIRVEIMPDFDIGIDEWFWKIVHIWGPNFEDEKCVKKCVKNVCKTQNRGFCVKNFEKTDISETDIWRQVQFWLAKNYDF